jgi:hypothetical protein
MVCELFNDTVNWLDYTAVMTRWWMTMGHLWNNIDRSGHAMPWLAQKGSRDVNLLVLNISTRWWCSQRHAPATWPQERDAIPIVQKAGWDTRLSWRGMENISCPYWGSKPRLTSLYLVTISLDYRGPNSDWKNLNTMRKICANAILPSTITHALTWKLPRDSTVIGQWQLPESQHGLNPLAPEFSFKF